MAINFFLAYFLEEKSQDRTGEGLAKFTQFRLSYLPSDTWSTWILSSHDSKRVATKVATSDMIDEFYMLLLLLPGTPILYYEEEIGMENRQFTEEIRYEMNNLSGYSYGINDESKIEKTCDGQRTPMCDEWNYALFGFLISTIALFTYKTRVYIGN